MPHKFIIAECNSLLFCYKDWNKSTVRFVKMLNNFDKHRHPRNFVFAQLLMCTFLILGNSPFVHTKKKFVTKNQEEQDLIWHIFSSPVI